MNWELVRLRKNNHLTQETMASMLGISLNSYHRKETGKSEFKPIECFKIAKHFNRTIEDIFFK